MPTQIRRLASGWFSVCFAAGLAHAQTSAISPASEVPRDAGRAQLVAHSTADFYRLASENSDRDLSLDMECDILYYDAMWGVLWIQTGDQGEYAAPGAAALPIASGDRVRVRGEFTAPLRELSLAQAAFEVIGRAHGTPLALTIHDLDRPDHRNSLISIEAWVDKQDPVDLHHIRLSLSADGHAFVALVSVDDPDSVRGLVDRRVRVTGVFAPQLDVAGNVVDLQLMVPAPDRIEAIGFVGDDPRFEIPLRNIGELDACQPGELVRISGELIHQEIGRTLSLRDHTGQIDLASQQLRYLQARQMVEAVGVVHEVDGRISLSDLSFRAKGSDLPLLKSDAKAARQLFNLAGQIRELPLNELDLGNVATLRGVVTWSRPDSPIFYLQDSSGGIEVIRPPDAPYYAPGIMLDVRGAVAAGDFAPVVHATQLFVLGTLAFPAPAEISFEQALSGSVDAQWVAMRGYVYEVTKEGALNRLSLSTNDGDFVAWVPSDRHRQDWLRCELRLEGVCRTITDTTRQLQTIELAVPDEALVSVGDRAPVDPFAAPERELDRLALFNPEPTHNNFVKVSGTVVHHTAGGLLYLADRGQVLRVQTRESRVFAQGSRVEIAGRLGRADGRPILREALLRDLGTGALPTVQKLAPDFESLAPYEGHIIQVEGELINLLTVGPLIRLTVQYGAHIFDAELTRRDAKDDLPADLKVGAVVSLTGVVVPAQFNAARNRGFGVVIRQSRDIRVLRAPSWWTTSHLATLALTLVLAVIAVTAWVRVLALRVAAQTTQIKQQLEREHQLSEQLQRASRLESLGLLAGGIAHDFNNLLTVVLGNLSLLRLDTPPASEADRSLRDAERAVGRAQKLTQQLLTFSKGGAPVRSTEDLTSIVREVTAFALHGTSVKLRLHLPEDAWPALVDKGQIGQLIQNLALNAAQAMTDGGILHVRLFNEVSAAQLPASLPPGRYLRLEISDNGCGIPPDALPKIFDPYFSTKQNGHGLGLATVYSIVRKHQGDIDVQSEVGVGTTFKVWLPAAASPLSQLILEPESGPLHGEGERVLVMDDEAEIRDLADKMLRNLGYQAFVTTDGAAAVRAFRHARESGHPFQLVILDLTIRGGMGGVETLRQLRAIDPTVAAVVSSGYSADQAVAAHANHGFDGLIPKPYEIHTFARVIREVLERQARTKQTS